MHTPYADVTYYQTHGGGIPEDKLEKQLQTASRHVDSLTYNRIVGRGFSNLTEFQQEIVREVCCQLADFEYENRDLIETALSGYSLNGVSVQFSSSCNVYRSKGIVIRKDIYALLSQSGLCCRLAR